MSNALHPRVRGIVLGNRAKKGDILVSQDFGLQYIVGTLED